MLCPPTFRMQASRLISRLLVLLFVLVVAGCSSDESQTKSKKKPKKNDQPVVEVIPPPRAPLVGEPAGAGFVDEEIQFRVGRDESDVRGVLAYEAKAFLVVVRMSVNEGEQTLVPGDYRMVVEETNFRPLAVSFGESKNTFFGSEAFLSSKVQLVHEAAGRLMIQDDTNRVAAVELDKPELHLVFKAEGEGDIEFWHGKRQFELDIVGSSTWKSLDGAGSAADEEAETTQAKKGGLQIELQQDLLVIGELNGEKTEVYELNLKLSSETLVDVDFTTKDLYLSGGEKRTRRILLKLDAERMRLHAGSVYSDTRYNDGKLTELHSGGGHMTVGPGKSLALRLVFPNPPFEAGLEFHFPDRPPMELIPAADAFGQIRPALSDAVKIAIPRAEMIGKLVRVAMVDGKIGIRGGGSKKSDREAAPGGGNEFLMLRFDMHDRNDLRFAANDYLVISEDGKRKMPKYISFGRSQAVKIPGDGFSPVKMIPGSNDRARMRKDVLIGWTYSEPEFIIVYEVPQGQKKFTFEHGSTRLTLQPGEQPISWASVRPDDRVVASRKIMTASGSGKTKTSRPVSTATKEKRAASALKLARVFAKKSPAKAKQYAQKVIDLVPDTDMAKEAKTLIEDIELRE